MRGVRAWAEGGRAERGEAAWALAGAGSMLNVGVNVNTPEALEAEADSPHMMCTKDMVAADPPPLSTTVASGLGTWTRAEGIAAEVNAPDGIAQGSKSPEDIAAGGMATLRLAWKHEMGRCVDAAPLLVCEAWDQPRSSVHNGEVSGGGVSGGGVREGVNASGAITETARAVCCYVGSHAGRLAAVCLATGSQIWNTQLPDRIEASCAISADGATLFVGGYDEQLHAVRRSDGVRLWNLRSNWSSPPQHASAPHGAPLFPTGPTLEPARARRHQRGRHLPTGARAFRARWRRRLRRSPERLLWRRFGRPRPD